MAATLSTIIIAYLHTANLTIDHMRLPFELLAEIACIFPAEIWTFASVCRHWRYATLLHSKCWNCIHVKQTEESESVTGLEYRLKLWAERGGQSPLELLLEGPFHHLVLSEPFIGCLSRIRTLHLDAWPFECDDMIQPITFPSLEALSVTSPNGQSRITLERVSAAFFGNSDQQVVEALIKAPRLRELALTRVHIHNKLVSKLSSLVTLKLVGCTTASSAFLLGILTQARRSLKALCLQDIAMVAVWPPAPEEKLSPVEFQTLASLTLVNSSASRVLAVAILPQISAPNLAKLTCDDNFLPLMDPHRFPTLSHLYVRSLKSSSLNTYQKVLKNFSILTLTILRDPSARCGLNVLLWSMSQDPQFGKTLIRLKYLTKQKAVVQSLLDMLNKERAKSRSMAQGTVFASQTVIYEDRDEYEFPWDAEMWWTRE